MATGTHRNRAGRRQGSGGEGCSPAAAGPQEVAGATSGHEAAKEAAEAEKKAADARGGGGGRHPGPGEAGTWWERAAAVTWRAVWKRAALQI